MAQPLRKRSLSFLRQMILVLAMAGLLSQPRPAWAVACAIPDCTCVFEGQSLVQAADTAMELAVQLYFGTAQTTPDGTGSLGTYQQWLDDWYISALMDMTQQLTTVMMDQMLVVGSLLDAKNQLETQELFQRLTAQAHKDYQSSFQMCVFGTSVRGLGAAYFNGNLTSNTLADQQLDREMAHGDTKGVGGPNSDRMSRLQQFKDRYCDIHDNNYIEGNAVTGLGLVCDTNPTASTVDRDVDYIRTLLLPRTLAIDFSDGTISDDQQDIIALSNNLYASTLFDNFGKSIAGKQDDQIAYLDQRAVTAKRSVAEQSFNALVGMKTQGPSSASSDSQPYLEVLLEELGLPKGSTDLTLLLGSRPSYMAQLEVLSKWMYMRPEFYADLYDTPANVKRRSVAMQAIGSMVGRDTMESELRSESILSVLLELKLMPEEQRVVNGMNQLSAQAQ